MRGIIMSSIWKMAWRNLSRHRGRTLLSILAVFFGILVIILFRGMMDGMIDSSVNTNINLNSGHLRLIRSEYQIKEKLLSLSYPVGENGKSYSDLIREIRRLPGVKKATGRIRFGMILAAGDFNETVIGIGSEPQTEEQISHLSMYLRDKGEGRLPREGKREILLGASLLKELHLKVGDKVNAVFSTSMASFKVATFTVVGKMASGLRFLDENAAYIPLDQAMNLLELPDMVTEIVVFGNDTGSTNSLSKTLQGYLKTDPEALKMIPWNQYSEFISAFEKVKAVCNLFYVFILLLASFVLFNTMIMVVSERTQEIGVLSAMGMTYRTIWQLFIGESFIIAVTGSLAGTIVGGALNWFMSRNGLDISQALGLMPSEMTLLPKIYPSYSLGILLFSFILGIIITMVAAYIPARRAALLKPTEALRTI
jgi:ABC-type transport system, involved in lipoprotein release, permease component